MLVDGDPATSYGKAAASQLEGHQRGRGNKGEKKKLEECYLGRQEMEV